jgi:glucokinase
MGEAAGDAVANAVTLVDAPVVIGGGLAGAARWFLPALVAEANGDFATGSGGSTTRLVSRAFNLEDPEQLERFTRGETRQVRVPGSARSVAYDPLKRVGIGLSRLGTERAVALGAYAVALDALDAA